MLHGPSAGAASDRFPRVADGAGAEQDGPDRGPGTGGRLQGKEKAPVPGPRSPVPASWADHLLEHLARYPLAEAQDVYKFTHQSVFGPAHAVPDKEGARRFLDEEIAALPPGPPDEPQVDVLGDDPPLVRLNLRPWVAAGGDVGALVDAFAATAGDVHGEPQEMARRLATAVTVLRGLGREGDAAALTALASAQAEEGFPALHHSAAYRAAYAPAYRVVSPGPLGLEERQGAQRRPSAAAPAPAQPLVPK
jgi:hypothetical protein